jgi:hypothetical protein
VIAVNECIAAHRYDGASCFLGARGKTVPLELIKIGWAVGRLESNEGYFACGEFRNLSEPATSRDIDFKLDVQAGSVHVAGARSHEISAVGSSTQAPTSHCRFEGQAFAIAD